MKNEVKEAQSFDVFSNKTGSWKFLCAVEAKDTRHAKEIVMNEHRISNWNGVCVYPTK